MSFFAEYLKALVRSQVRGDQFGTGALLDRRGDRSNDVFFSEVVAGANPVVWVEKDPANWRRFPVRNQGPSFSCMANAYAKLLGVQSYVRDGEFINFSSAHIYQRRVNKPYPGMFLYDVFGIGSRGVTLEALAKSDSLPDEKLDSLIVEPHEVRVGEVFAQKDTPIYIESGDFDTVASVIQTTGKAVLGMFYFKSDEYSRLIPEVKNKNLLNAGDVLRHGVALVDVFTYNGVQVIRAEDSAHFGGLSERLITRDFFERRNFGTAYSMGFKFDEAVSEKPRYDGSIVSAQLCLRYEGFFPLNVSTSENIGPVTREALKKFQLKYGIDPTGNLGTKTQTKLRTLYGV